MVCKIRSRRVFLKIVNSVYRMEAKIKATENELTEKNWIRFF